MLILHFVEIGDCGLQQRCPLGAECNKGPTGAIWKTDDVAAELIAIALETHVKDVHQNGTRQESMESSNQIKLILDFNDFSVKDSILL